MKVKIVTEIDVDEKDSRKCSHKCFGRSHYIVSGKNRCNINKEDLDGLSRCQPCLDAEIEYNKLKGDSK